MLPASQSDISTTNSFSRRIACDKLGLSVKGAVKITDVILTEGCVCDKPGLSVKGAGIAKGDD